MHFQTPLNQRFTERKMPITAITFNQRHWCASVAILICLLSSGVVKTNAVPTNSGSASFAARHLSLLQRASRDISAASLQREESKKAITNAASTDTAMGNVQQQQQQPQEDQCLLDGMLVAATTVFCEKPVGCRAIQKTGHCCPDYKCDCSKDGKTYSNGDKLVDPETPCTVCYCQGGEILCSSVTCFYRGDCQPRYIPGRCCPEYNNCPVSVAVSNQTSTTVKPEMPIVAALNPKITIKEITKPIEIRITDDNKQIQIHQMRKASTTTQVPPTQSTTTTTTTTTTTPTTLKPEAPSTISTTLNTSTSSATTTIPTTIASIQSNNDKSSQTYTDNNPKATPTTVGINNKNESLKLSASVAYPSTEYSSSSYVSSNAESNSERFDEIVMVKNGNGDEKPISVFGTQGLQRVESESVNDSNKVNIKREYLATTEGNSNVAMSKFGATPTEDYALELIFANTGSTPLNSAPNEEPDTAGSDSIYQIILTTDGPRWDSSTMTFVTEGVSQASTVEAYVPTSPATAPTQASKKNEFLYTKGPKKTMTTAGPFEMHNKHATTDGMHHADEEDVAMPVESNPAYPSLPEDDFSLRDVNFPLTETEDVAEMDSKDEMRSIMLTAIDPLKSTKHLEENDDSGSGMLILPSSTETGLVGGSSTKQTLNKLQEKVQLMYSAEDSSAETAISNSTDFQLENLMRDSENETGSGQLLEMDSLETVMYSNGSGSGSGSGEIVMARQREYTTPRPMRASQVGLEIDELGASGDGNAEPLDDPKLDAESLKVNENQDYGIGKGSDVAMNGDILTVKAFPTQDKTFEETPTIGRLQRLYLQRVF